MLHFYRMEFFLPCEKDFRVLLAGDTHLIHVDRSDGQRKKDLAARRVRDFGAAEDVQANWCETIVYANENCDLFLHAGDLIDFVSHGNLQLMAESRGMFKIPCLFAAGNHEFSQYVGEAKEDDAYKGQSFETVQHAAGNSLDFASLQYNGVNFVSIDNSYYLFKERHIALLQKECEKGLPVILLLHNPLYSPGFHELVQHARRDPCSYLCGVPLEKMEGYSEHRREQQKPDASTAEMLDYIKNNTSIKGIFAGHLHSQFMSRYTADIPQIVTAGNYSGSVTEITFRKA